MLRDHQIRNTYHMTVFVILFFTSWNWSIGIYNAYISLLHSVVPNIWLSNLVHNKIISTFSSTNYFLYLYN